MIKHGDFRVPCWLVFAGLHIFVSSYMGVWTAICRDLGSAKGGTHLPKEVFQIPQKDINTVQDFQ